MLNRVRGGSRLHAPPPLDTPRRSRRQTPTAGNRFPLEFAAMARASCTLSPAMAGLCLQGSRVNLESQSYNDDDLEAQYNIVYAS
jgi:hypothetical protein